MSKSLARGLAGLVRALSRFERPWRRSDTLVRVANKLMPHNEVQTSRGAITFLSTHPQSLDYPRTFFSREPETLAWIDAFATPCRFWDIGANIGAYSVYAGLDGGVEVSAFEPAAASYAALNENIHINGLHDRIRAYCIALSETTELAHLNMEHTNPGSVVHAFGTDVDYSGRRLNVAFRQGLVGYSIDEFRRVFSLPAPHYIKLDVDSIELQILKGAAETLQNPEVRELLVELEADARNHGDIIGLLDGTGFTAAPPAGDQPASNNQRFTRRRSGRD